ncbi:MAG: hypothetical protein MI745_13735 [Pseudomonadales bacterium]|nr:hypothetical protein [Pseudomonadales bacterium]
MKKAFRMLCAALILASAGGVQAAITATELAMVEADAWRARMGFHLLSIRGDNPEDREALKQLLAEGQERVMALQDAAESGEKERMSAIGEAWQALSERAMDNPLASLGYADYGAMSEMNTTTLAVASQVEDAEAGTSGKYRDVAALSTAMQRVGSEYLALAAFPSAGLPTGTGLPPMDFAIEAKKIDNQLDTLKKKYRADAQASEVLNFISQRWAFVRNTIPRMNEQDANKVPYLFYRYATQVAERVEELVSE